MISDLAICQTVARLYDDTDTSYKYAYSKDDVHCAVYAVDNCDVIVFRGSVDATDWMRDFSAVPVYVSGLGWVHDGFQQGMTDALAELLPVLTDRPVVVSGHSLGAARAYIAAGMLELSGNRPAACVVFGPPRPGFGALTRVLAPVPTRGYCNEGDPVCDVPLAFDHPGVEIKIHEPATPGDPWGPLRCHHIELYVQGAPD